MNVFIPKNISGDRGVGFIGTNFIHYWHHELLSWKSAMDDLKRSLAQHAESIRVEYKSFFRKKSLKPGRFCEYGWWLCFSWHYRC